MDASESLSPVVLQILSAPPQLFSIAARIFVSAFESAVVVFASSAHVVTILPFSRPSSHFANAFISACANFPDSLRIDFWHLTASACAVAGHGEPNHRDHRDDYSIGDELHGRILLKGVRERLRYSDTTSDSGTKPGLPKRTFVVNEKRPISSRFSP